MIELLNSHYGIAAQSVELISEGADMHASAYKAVTASKSYFIKQKLGDYDEINLAIIRLLHDSGLKEILFPVATRNGELFKEVDGFRVIVYPFIDACNGFSQDLTEKQWNLLGRALKSIHGTAVPLSIQQQLRKETYSPKWRDMVKSFLTKIEADASDDVITTEFKLFFQTHLNTIQQIVNTADELSKKIQPDTTNYVLCHADIHAGNVLLEGGESIYIIDWDEPMMAPKERDLMFIGGGVGNVWNKPHEVSYFYDGYGKCDIDISMMCYYRHERIVVDIAEYATALLSNDIHYAERVVMLNHFKAMFDVDGVVDIAFAMERKADI